MGLPQPIWLSIVVEKKLEGNHRLFKSCAVSTAQDLDLSKSFKIYIVLLSSAHSHQVVYLTNPIHYNYAPAITIYHSLQHLWLSLGTSNILP
jgi:hypothetical protein